MTTHSEECPVCKRYEVTKMTCDGCGRVIGPDEPYWSVSPRMGWEDGEIRHACSVNCLEAAVDAAGWEDKELPRDRVYITWEGHPADAFALVRAVSSQSRA